MAGSNSTDKEKKRVLKHYIGLIGDAKQMITVLNNMAQRDPKFSEQCAVLVRFEQACIERYARIIKEIRSGQYKVY